MALRCMEAASDFNIRTSLQMEKWKFGVQQQETTNSPSQGGFYLFANGSAAQKGLVIAANGCNPGLW